MLEPLDALLGIHAGESIVWWQAIARGVVTYVAALAMVRIGEKRFLGKSTAFDMVIGVMLGSVVSRGITGSATLGASLAGGLTLVSMHWLLAAVSFRSHRFGTLVKGRPRLLVENGRIHWDEMKASHVSQGDLLGALRANGGIEDIKQVKAARLERNGEISVVKRSDD